jgi:Raf kinase inhibitor-like YbhB/YbcL family protein
MKASLSACLFLGALIAITPACGGDDDGSGGGTTTGSGAGGTGTGGTGTGGVGTGAGGGMGGSGGMLPFELTSTAFMEGETWPTQYECGPPLSMGPGMNISPPLSWTPGPAETQSYAIVMRDLDFMSLVHWVIYDIPASALGLPEGIPSGYDVADPAGAKQAQLQMVQNLYLGPCSPQDINTYELTVHALDVATLSGLDENSQENDVAAIVEAMSLASAKLSGES